MTNADSAENAETENHGGLFGPAVRAYLRIMIWLIYTIKEVFQHPRQNKWVLVGCSLYGIVTVWLMWEAGFFQGCGHWNVWTGCY